MQNQKELSPEESFVIIQGMIATARNKFAENGFHLMLWGVLVITCCLANYFLLADGFGNLSGLPWAVMPFIGVPVGIMYEKNRMSAKQVSTHADLHVKTYLVVVFSRVGACYCILFGFSYLACAVYTYCYGYGYFFYWQSIAVYAINAGWYCVLGGGIALHKSN